MKYYNIFENILLGFALYYTFNLINVNFIFMLCTENFY
jgi:hypothetical protein